MLKVNELFKSIEGETTFAGLPCIFVRLSGCNLRCTYCDTEYAYYEGMCISNDEIIKQITCFSCKLICITGGEPLLQKETMPLLDKLINDGYTVILETNGSISVEQVHKKVIIIMDIKCPSSNESGQMHWKNISYLKKNDQIKYVLQNKKDYLWAKETMEKYSLHKKAEVLFMPNYKKLSPKKLSQWILEDNLPVRLQVQLHKYIWKANEKEGMRISL
ncbi:radical SAM protein [Chlamydiota bacterium]